jgi:site-specific DNA-cytosine methylase
LNYYQSLTETKNNVDTTRESPVIISLCTGIRGLERGLERALRTGVTVAAYAEIEAFIVANLIAGMESGVLAPAPVWTDLKTFPFGQFHEKVHGIIGGYPCQPFSVAGKQLGTEDPRHLWPYIKAGISAARPIFCFFENVRGHLKLGFYEVYNDLRELGYEVRFGIYSAEEVGAPHRRERLFILAILADSCSYGDKERYFSGRIHRNSEETEGTDREREWRGYESNPSGKPDDTRLFGPAQRQEQTAGIEQSSEMANSTGAGLQESRPAGVRELSEEEREGLYDRSKQSSSVVANANSSRSTQDQQLSKREGTISDSEPSRTQKWPTYPGRQQHDWEEPRTTKSGMGITINGYNFREDLLRAAGNGVVEQTAEFAFLDLLSQF